VVLAADEPIGTHVAIREDHVVDLAPTHRLDPEDLDPGAVARHRDHAQARVLVRGSVRPSDDEDVVCHVGP
jgi:hypothetical protein